MLCGWAQQKFCTVSQDEGHTAMPAFHRVDGILSFRAALIVSKSGKWVLLNWANVFVGRRSIEDPDFSWWQRVVTVQWCAELGL